jgi:hypothetical protein
MTLIFGILPGGFFKTRIGGPEGALDRDDEERHRDERLGEHDSRRGEGQRDPEPLVQVLADHAAPAEHQQERHTADDRRQDQRHGHQSAQHAPSRQVAAREQPRERHAEHEADDRGE